MKIGIFVAVCGEDFHWVPQFMRQAEILGWPVAWYADRLWSEQLKVLQDWPQSVGVYDGREQFSERSKEQAFKMLVKGGFDWAVQMDIDETWQEGAKEIIEADLTCRADEDIGVCPMVTVSEYKGQLYRRTEPYFTSGVESARARIYNLAREWHWLDPVTCGAIMFSGGRPVDVEAKVFRLAAASVHWGHITRESTAKHMEKWHQVWMSTIGRIPYDAYDTLTNVDYRFSIEPLEDIFYKHL